MARHLRVCWRFRSSSMGFHRTCRMQTKRSPRDDTAYWPEPLSRSTSERFVPSSARRLSPGGMPMFPAAMTISRPRKMHKTAWTPHSATMPASTGSKRIKTAKPAEPTLARQIDVLYLIYLEKQVDPELLKQITAKANGIEKTFNGYRANVNGRMITDSEVRRVLKESRDPAERKAVWEGSKGVGPLVEPDLKALVKLRNQAARQARIRRLSQTSASPERADRKSRSSNFSTSSTSSPASHSGSSSSRSTPNWPSKTESRSTNSAPGITTIRSSRKHLLFSRPISTRFTRKPISSNSAATFTPESACRSTT